MSSVREQEEGGFLGEREKISPSLPVVEEGRRGGGNITTTSSRKGGEKRNLASPSFRNEVIYRDAYTRYAFKKEEGKKGTFYHERFSGGRDILGIWTME